MTAHTPQDNAGRLPEWVDRYATSLYRFAYRLIGDRQLAEDVVQETYCDAWQGMHRLRDSKSAGSWLFTIARRRALKALAKRRREASVTSSGIEIDAAQDEAPSSAPNNEAIDSLQVALMQLEEKFRSPLLLRVMEQLTVDEAAKILGIRRGTVLSRIHRARQKLAEILSEVDEPRKNVNNQSTSRSKPKDAVDSLSHTSKREPQASKVSK